MDISCKLELLKDISDDETDFDRILGKLLDTVLSQHRLRAKQYESDLREFENRYSLESATFYKRFEAGEMGDAMDYFEWAGLYELYQKAQDKIRRLE